MDATPRSYVTNKQFYSSSTQKWFLYAFIFLWAKQMKLGGIERWIKSSSIGEILVS
jgi:hypothetical protein